MRCGFVVPFADAREFAELAALGERHGWDAVLTWEAVYGVDAWVTLGAAAMVTERIRLGTLLTPASRYKPWDLASRVGTVDRLSGGRVVMSVGLGALHEGWLAFEADEGRRARAEKLDECLEIYAGLLGGQPYTFSGKHWSARPTDFGNVPPPVQRPHPPVWVVATRVHGRERQPSLERAARWDGVLPALGEEDGIDAFAEITSQMLAIRAADGRPAEGYDIVIEGDSTGEFVQREGTPHDWEQAGATWWVESWWSVPQGPDGLAEVRRRVAAGPPVR